VTGRVAQPVEREAFEVGLCESGAIDSEAEVGRTDRSPTGRLEHARGGSGTTTDQKADGDRGSRPDDSRGANQGQPTGGHGGQARTTIIVADSPGAFVTNLLGPGLDSAGIPASNVIGGAVGTTYPAPTGPSFGCDPFTDQSPYLQ
jgi:hypothetical protein